LNNASWTIALDASYSVGANLSGVGVYAREIRDSLPAAHPDAKFLLCYRPHRYLRAPALERSNVRKRLLWGGSPRSMDLFHGLNQRLDRRYRRAVATFHDLFVLTGEYSTPDFRQRFAAQAREAAERADLIISVSEFTASQVHDVLKVERSRLRVIPHGVRGRPVSGNAIARESMILFVGAIQKRKNVDRLVEAFERTPAEWKLVLAGSMGFGADRVLQAIERSPRRTDIEITGYVSDDELDRLYGRASIFAFPSLDEGFGIPVLEAMSRGLPVLTSDRSALPEVAGDAALLVDPCDPEAIATGLCRLIADRGLRIELSRKGRERSADYTWERASKATWDVYCELLGSTI
jgi:glycosyltransferase involved in cell wall biosynthesis